MTFNKIINWYPEKWSLGWSLVYLISSRPLYTIGIGLITMPLILNNQFFSPLQKLMAHSYWTPFARLTYGVFLCNSIFMEFRIFNLEQGIWADKFNTNLYFFSFLTISFCFSMISYIFIEAPFANILNEFIRAYTPVENKSNYFSRSQSAKAFLRDQRRK